MWGHEWQQKFKYIAAPIAKGIIYNDIDKLQGLSTILAPEFAPEMALARGAIEFGKTQAGPRRGRSPLRGTKPARDQELKMKQKSKYI